VFAGSIDTIAAKPIVSPAQGAGNGLMLRGYSTTPSRFSYEPTCGFGRRVK
jgi:hypothetical protein